METLSTSFGRYSLQRLPVIKDASLRAWDAADELLLSYVSEQELITASSKILLINDQFGALSVSLHKYSPQNWSDSYQSHLAAQHNLKMNQLPEQIGQIDYVPSTQSPKGNFDLVLVKVPKTMALLEDQLIRLRPHISVDTQIIAAAMTKHIHTSTLKLFEDILGSTKTSLAKKKARLIFADYQENKESRQSPYPKSFHDNTWDITLSNHANVFAKEKLDVGARFMLEQFKRLPPSQHIIDLGCGNGVLGIMAKRQQPDSHITFVDESYMAVDSAKTNYENVFTNHNHHADFLVSDALSELSSSGLSSEKEIDLILCNPPFHQQYAIGDHIAWEMLKQSHQHLQQGGQLWVVGNRHLAYHVKLKRLFGNCQTIASSKKFVVLAAQKP